MHRLMCGAFGSIAIRSWLEIRLENRLQYELERALHHSVTDSGDRQDANFSSFLRCLPPPCSWLHIGPINQFVVYLLKDLLDALRLDDHESPPINSRSSVVLPGQC